MEAAGADEAAAGKFERLAPGGGPGLYLTTGSLALAPGARAPVLQLEAQECRFGPLPVPLMTRESSERLSSSTARCASPSRETATSP